MSALVNHFATRAAAAGLRIPTSASGLGLPGTPALRGSGLYSKVLASAAGRRARAQILASRKDASVHGHRVDSSPEGVKARGDVHRQARDLALVEEWTGFLHDYYRENDPSYAAQAAGGRIPGVGPGANRADGAARLDGVVPMAAEALTYFYSEPYTIEHADLPAWNGDILRIDRSVDPAAENYVWWEKDLLGVARASNSYSTMDIPIVAGPVANPNFGTIIPALVGMEVNFMDMRRAALARRNGKPDFDVDRSMAQACQRSLAEFAHFLWLYGDATLGVDGLHNHPAVATITLPGGPWSGKTAAQILADLNTMWNTIRNTSLGSLRDFSKLKIILPPPQYQQANILPITAAGDKSVLKYFKENNSVKDEQIVQMDEFEASKSQIYTGGPQGLAADRALVVYEAGDDGDPMFVLPQDIEMPAPPRQNGLSETTFYHMRVGGMKVPDARRIRYVEGL